MSGIGCDIPVFLQLVFLLILFQLLPLVVMEYKIYTTCPGANSDKRPIKIAIVLDWNSIATDNSSNTEGSDYGMLLSSHSAQAAISQALLINNSSQILSEHKFCLVIVLYRFNEQDTLKDFHVTLGGQGISAVVNAIMDEESFNAQYNILSHYFPTLLIQPHAHCDCFSPEGLHKAGIPLSTSFYITLGIIPSQESLLTATLMFTSYMGWEKIGVIENCEEPRSTETFHNSTIFFTRYDHTDFIRMFKPFAQNEIRIYIFIGNLMTYLQLIRVAYTMGVTQKGYDIIIPNFSWVSIFIKNKHKV